MKQFLISLSVMLSLSASAQKVIYRGMVTSANGAIIDGASVKITGEGATITNKDGKFLISSAKKAPVIIISHAGYKTREIRADSTFFHIILEESVVAMKEVTVSTGYQELVKQNVTGSFDKVDNKLFNRSQSMDVLSRLEGTASSVYFQKTGGGQGIFIRGLSTILASTSPLIVLDNFPYEGNINNINPNDVESITILKDAAAAAIWGARAGNGVIVITTKKGRYGEKSKLTFNSSVTLQDKPDLYKDNGFLDANDFIDLEKFLFSKGKYDADISNTSNRPIISPVVEILARQRLGLISAAAADQQINALRSYDIRDDYTKYLYTRGVRQQYSLGLSGGSTNINYLINGGYDNNQGNARGSNSGRATFYALTNIRAVKKLELQVGVNYGYTKNNNNSIGPILPSGKSGLYPYARLADSAGNPLPVPLNYREGYTDTAGGNLLFDWKYRPLDEQKIKDNTNTVDDILFKMDIRYQVIKDLQVQLSGQYEKSFSNIRNYNSPDSYTARVMLNRFSQRTATGIIHNMPVGGILDYYQTWLQAYAARGQLNFNKKGEQWQLSAIAGAELRQSRVLTHYGTIYGYNDNTLNSVAVDNVTTFTLYGNFGTGTIPDNTSLGDVLNRYVSLYSNATLTWKKLIFSASGRKDASNLFGVETNNKWTPLWSVGLGWKISNEIKARLTYGYNGNVKNDLAAVPTIRYVNVDPINNQLNAQVNTLPNPELRWENVAIVNAGFDINTKDDRLNTSFEYFHKNARNLLSPTAIDPTIGIAQMTLNTANLSGEGVDVKVNYKVIDKKVKVSTFLIFSYVKNKVTKYLSTAANKGGYTGTGYAITPIEGQDPYALISYKWAGLDPLTGDPQGYLNGVVSKDYAKLVAPTVWEDLAVSGTTRPPFFGNMIPSVSWQAITFSFNIGFKFGYYFRRNSINYGSLFSSWSGNKEFLTRWQQPGDEQFTSVPSLVYPAVSNRDKFYNNSESTVEKGDIVRLQDISVNWEIKKIQLYMNAGNLGLLWRANKVGADPDYGTGMPSPFYITFGLKAGL